MGSPRRAIRSWQSRPTAVRAPRCVFAERDPDARRTLRRRAVSAAGSGSSQHRIASLSVAACSRRRSPCSTRARGKWSSHPAWAPPNPTRSPSASVLRTEEVLPQTPHGPAIRAAGHRHRRVEQLSGRAPRDRAVGEAPAVEVSGRSSRELPSTHPCPGAGDEALHISQARATLLFAFSGISPHFRPRRHRLSGTDWRHETAERFAVWTEITGQATAS